MKFEPRQYQTGISNEAVKRLKELGLVYLAMEVRTGKTFTALMTAHKYGAHKILFLTVKKAISDIKGDVKTFGVLDVEVLSIDSAHKADGDYDLVIIDEAHGISSFPKPSKRAKSIRQIAAFLPIIFLSGTPNPESLSQLYHQFWVSDRSPWGQYRNFYAWAKDFVDVKQRKFNGYITNDYSRGIKSMIQPYIDKYFLTFSQVEAGFICTVKEHIHRVPMTRITQNLIESLQENKVVDNDMFTILADTPVKLMSKVHQLSSGTVITEEGDVMQVDDSKITYIKKTFQGQKLAIFYKYKGELEMIKKAYRDQVTEDVQEFNDTDKHIALQIRAGSMGINLSKADAQVFVNIDFSSKDYIQSRARQQTQKRDFCDVHFIFSEDGIESKIYKLLQKKQDFTSMHFKRFFQL